MNSVASSNVLLLAALVLILVAPIVASATDYTRTEVEYDLTISAYPRGAGPYVIGEDTITITGSARNWGVAVWVDVHVAIIAPDGTIYEWGDWNTDFRPVLSNYFMHPGWTFETELGTYLIGDPSFPASVPGDYFIVSAITQPGTFNFLSDIRFHGFFVEPQTNPNETWGGVGISWKRSYEGDNEEGGVDLYVGATFKGHYGQEEPYPGRLEEGCQVYERDEFFDMYYTPGYDYGYIRGLDGGDKIDMLGGPLGDVELARSGSRRTGIRYSPDGSLEEGHYGGGNTYTFVGHSGTDVGPFSVSVVAPPILDLLQPALGRDQFGYVHVIYRDQDLLMRWTGQSDGQVLVLIFADDAANSIGDKVCLCTFDDDGEATIPSHILSQLPPIGYPYYPAVLEISRENIVGFTADGLSEGGVASIDSRTFGIAELQ